MHRPTFMVVGAQKSGTTYLCAALSRHRDVFHSDPKELLFFQRTDVDDASFADYLRHFAKADKERWIGEGSAVYLQWPLALENIRKYLGDQLKIFICLRQPTDRAVSFYLHNLRKGRFDGTERIDQVGADIRLSPVLSSLYGEHIERWLGVYGDNVQFLLFDDLVASPESFVRSATDFLGIKPSKVVRENAVNAGYALEWDGESLTVDGSLPDSVQRPRFSRAQLEDLQALFLADIDRTAALIGKPLEHWKRLPEFTAKHANFAAPAAAADTSEGQAGRAHAAPKARARKGDKLRVNPRENPSMSVPPSAAPKKPKSLPPLPEGVRLGDGFHPRMDRLVTSKNGVAKRQILIEYSDESFDATAARVAQAMQESGFVAGKLQTREDGTRAMKFRKDGYGDVLMQLGIAADKPLRAAGARGLLRLDWPA